MLNRWNRNIQVLLCGVPSGGRDGNVLYFTDMVSTTYKKYRIPAPNNPRYFKSTFEEDIKRYGGIDTQDFVNLVLGQHGDPTVALIPLESLRQTYFPFMSCKYDSGDQSRGYAYEDKLLKVEWKEKIVRSCFAIDLGFEDPTIISYFVEDDKGVWKCIARWKLRRIQFPLQATIIHYLDSLYKPTWIAIDAGGGG